VADFIEVTLVNVEQGGNVGPRALRLIGIDQIAVVSSGVLGTGHIALTTGEKLNVQESYDELKKVLGSRLAPPEKKP
jgi:hypothetical protein